MRHLQVTLFLILLLFAAMAAHGQVQVFVPGNTNGGFGNPIDMVVPLVPTLTVDTPGTIQVTYISGTVTDAGGINTGPNGVPWKMRADQSPLQESRAVSGGKISNLDALIGVFVSQTRVQDPRGFNPVDSSKNLTRVGIKPSKLFFIGEAKSFEVTEPGTLYLGINDWIMGDNGGGFTVEVSGP